MGLCRLTVQAGIMPHAANRALAYLECPNPLTPPDTNPPIVPQPNNNPLQNNFTSPFSLHNPPGVGTVIQYDPNTNTYNFQYMTGNTPFGPGAYMDVNEYINYDLQQSINDYWHSHSNSFAGGGNRRGGGVIPQLHIGGDIFEGIFGSNTIDIRPSGSVELKFGVKYTQVDNDNLPVKQQRHTDFDFDQDIQLNLIAKIGDKIEFNLNYTTDQLTLDNNMDKIKLKYAGKEDELTSKYLPYYNQFADWTGRVDGSTDDGGLFIKTRTEYPIPFGSNDNLRMSAKEYYTQYAAQKGFESPVWKVAVNTERRKEFNCEWCLRPDMQKSGFMADHVAHNYPKRNVENLKDIPWTNRDYDYNDLKMDMPIPQDELIKNTLLEQNPAYRGNN